ncbi:MAG: STAS domain-containing protein [Abitibacteriaceae bacterium]|nr:STAS domain-containing protein [Abditibacteriaceae bacterium]MBV9864089.1 STAS domain-containing protein [Abditibacteriaceae bacterium]
MKELKIEHGTAPVEGRDVHILRLEGYVDAHTFTDFEEELTKLVEGGNYNLLLDLEKLTYINSTGLGLLMATFRQVRQYQGDLVIAKMSDKITNIFNLLGFSRLIHTYPTEQEALAQFGPSPSAA